MFETMDTTVLKDNMQKSCYLKCNIFTTRHHINLLISTITFDKPHDHPYT